MVSPLFDIVSFMARFKAVSSVIRWTSVRSVRGELPVLGESERASPLCSWKLGTSGASIRL